MPTNLGSNKNVLAGTVFVALGLVALTTASRYPLGTAFEMGPGYLPVVVSSLLVLVGIALIVSSLKDIEEPLSGTWRPLVLTLGAVVLFALLLEPFGLALATIVLVVVARLGGSEFRLPEVAILALALAVGVVLLFVYGLKMSIEVFPS